jgi:hypothetical protein
LWAVIDVEEFASLTLRVQSLDVVNFGRDYAMAICNPQGNRDDV